MKDPSWYELEPADTNKIPGRLAGGIIVATAGGLLFAGYALLFW